MPNYVMNEIEFKNPGKAIAIFGDGFDFNKIIEKPKTLDIISGSVTDDAITLWNMEVPYDKIPTPWYLDRTSLIGNYPDGEPTIPDEDYYTKQATPKTLGDLRVLAWIIHKNYKYFGHTDWYSWCNARWGTKWNACNVEWHGTAVTFETAWSGVPVLLNTMAQKFGLEFTYRYADEDIGNNVGSYETEVNELGEIWLQELIVEDAEALACELWGIDPEELEYDED